MKSTDDNKYQKGLEKFSIDNGSWEDVDKLLESRTSTLFDESKVKSKSTSGVNKKVVFSLLFFILTAFVLIYLLSGKTKSYTSSQLYAQYYKPIPAATIGKQRSSVSQTIIDGFVQYERGDFAKAAELLLDNDDVQSLTYGGISALNEGSADKAIRAFQKAKAMEKGESVADITDWYLAMAYLKLDDKLSATRTLEKVKLRGKFKSKEASVILESLKD